VVDNTLPALLRSAVAAFGDDVAFRSNEGHGIEDLTYRQLDERSAAVRDWLRARGVEPGSFVLLSGRNSLAWVIALWGSIRAGAVAVPVDPAMPGPSLEHVLAEVRPAIIFGDQEFLGRLPAASDGVWQPLEELGARTEPDEGGADHQPAPGELALMLYTSGTSGQPKGVMLSHRNITSNVEGVLDAAGLVPEDSLFVVLPMFHAFPLTVGCFSAIAGGVQVDLEHRPSRAGRRLAEGRPTLLIGVPALYETVLRQIHHRAGRGPRGWYLKAAKALNRNLIRFTGVNAGRILFRPLQKAVGGRLRLAISGGAALPPAVASDAWVLGLPLLQGYGQSEASPVIAVQRMRPRKFWFTRYYWRRLGTVGEALKHVEITIHPVPEAPQGEGEIVVRGPNVMLGYFRRPEETAEALVDGALRTGDLGRLEADGNLYITGRRRMTIKEPGGEMVNLQHVEAVLDLEPEIGQVAVVVENDPDWRLVAVVFPSGERVGANATAEEVTSAVRRAVHRASKSLRVYERPRAVRLTDRPLPVTRLGKVRRAELPREFSFDIATWRREEVALREAAGAER
jgi:long-chain acyl-CoA synthetase